MPDPLQLHVRTLRPNVNVLEVIGELAGPSQASLLDSWGQVGEAEVVILDFSRVTGIDGSGMSGLAALAARAGEQKQRLFIVGLDAKLRSILELTHLTDHLPIHDTEADVLSQLDSESR